MNPINTGAGKSAELAAMQEQQRAETRQSEKPAADTVNQTSAALPRKSR